jgi:hypothetical protein
MSTLDAPAPAGTTEESYTAKPNDTHATEPDTGVGQPDAEFRGTCVRPIFPCPARCGRYVPPSVGRNCARFNCGHDIEDHQLIKP